MDPNNFVVSADEIIPGLWLGNEAASQSSDFMRRNKIRMIVNATKNIPSRFLGKIYYIRVPVDDPGALSTGQGYHNEDVRIMKKCLPYVLKHIETARTAGMNILIHCHAGAQRSAIITACYLLYRRRATDPEDAIRQVINKRRIAFFGGESVNFREVLTN